MKYNPNIHHRRSIRLSQYDYSQAGLYFITICIHKRLCLFGEINNAEMILSDAGKIACDEWMKTPELRKNVELGAFIVMPNHIHGIIKITGGGVSHTPNMHPDEIPTSNIMHPDEIHNPIKLNSTKEGEFNSPLRSPSQTIGAIVRGYKSSVTKKIREMNRNNDCIIWQRNYYEHIIRDQQSYQIT